jgi:hypothetical protein
MVTGPPPNDPDKRRRRNADPLEGHGVVLPPEDRPDRPDMPLHPDHPQEMWHASTVAFWDVMADSPQAKLWGATDWHHLKETLLVYDRWQRATGTEYVNLERAVRARTGLMGYSHGDRLRLRMRAQVVATEADGTPAETAAAHHRGRGRKRDSARFTVHEGGAGEGAG